jgi:ribose transport system substrate-binding protein
MNSKSEIIKLLFVISLLLTFLEAKTYKIGFAQDTLSNDWRKAQADQLLLP